MDDRRNDRKIYDLNYLSGESWQLELLVSGIILLLLFQSGDWVRHLTYRASTIFEGGISTPFAILLLGIPASIAISKIFFVGHVLIRGLWIGTLGLRSVSGDIDIKGQNFGRWFNRYLRRYDNQFDEYIHRLEKLSSVLFSFNFLLIFYMFSILLSCAWISLFRFLSVHVADFFKYGSWYIGLGLFLSFIDFVSMQRLKKGRLSFIYYPFYIGLNILNLSFLYRALHYNFVDHKYTRRLLRLLVWGAFVLFFISGFTFHVSPWLADIPFSGKGVYNTTHYSDERKGEYLMRPYIRSFENADILELTLPIRESKADQKAIFSHCPELEEFSNIGWFSVNTEGSNFHLSTATEEATEEQMDQIIACHLSTEELSIDDIIIEPKHAMFFIEEDKEESRGIRIFIPIDDLDPGLHYLKIKSALVEGEEHSEASQVISFLKK